MLLIISVNHFWSRYTVELRINLLDRPKFLFLGFALFTGEMLSLPEEVVANEVTLWLEDADIFFRTIDVKERENY